METKKLSIRAASYPLPEDAPKRLKLFVILTPMFFMLAISLPSFIRQQLTPVICEEELHRVLQPDNAHKHHVGQHLLPNRR